jgi:hypothetical protein
VWDLNGKIVGKLSENRQYLDKLKSTSRDPAFSEKIVVSVRGFLNKFRVKSSRNFRNFKSILLKCLYCLPSNKSRSHLETFERFALFTLLFVYDSLWSSLFIFRNSPDDRDCYSREDSRLPESLESSVISRDVYNLKLNWSSNDFSSCSNLERKLLGFEKLRLLP